MADNKYDFGMIGLGTMGSNLLLNMADNKYRVIGFDLDAKKVESLNENDTEETVVKGVNTLEEFVQSLSTPRKIMMLVPAGKPVDVVIGNLTPLLQKDDIIIDGGNSYFKDTLRRVQECAANGLHFMGMGVSGGEKGARYGPSIMPGGDLTAFKNVKPLLEAIAAKVDGVPCTAYMGKDAAGHYVKMVHNGIEYAIMQMISEVYDVMHRGLGMNDEELHETFKKWDKGELQSFLVEITADIFRYKDHETGKTLVDIVLDKAGSKGTGKWTSQNAMDLGVPAPTIDIAVSMREVSAYKEERVQAAALYKPDVKKITGNKETVIKSLHDALYFGMIISYAQGLSIIEHASDEFKMGVPLPDVVKIWRGGCIIRSSLLEVFYKAFKKNKQLSNILLDKNIARLLKRKEKGMRNTIKLASQSRIPLSAIMSALGYFDAYCSETMPTNLIQAQRDYFGAHTFERTDKPGIFHNEWDDEERTESVQPN